MKNNNNYSVCEINLKGFFFKNLTSFNEFHIPAIYRLVAQTH